MRSLAAFVVTEARIQSRSLRFGVAGLLYVALGVAPAVVTFRERHEAVGLVGSTTYAVESMVLLPLLTTALAAVVAVDALVRERVEDSWPVLALTPMSSGGFVLRRYLAVLALVLPVTAVPMAAAAVLGRVGAGSLELGHFVGPWLTHLVPVAVAVTALVMGWGGIVGNAIAALVLALASGWAALGLLNSVLGRFHLVLGGPTLHLFGLGPQGASWSIAVYRLREGWFPYPASEAPWAMPAGGREGLVESLFVLGLGWLVLGLAVPLVRRTRPDIPYRPRRPDHPLRTLLGLARRLRIAFAPDPWPTLTDLAVITGLVGLGLAAGGLLVAEGAGAWARAAERYRVELAGDPAPTDPTVSFDRWRIRGRVDGSRVRTEVRTEAVARGDRPVSRLAFTVDPAMAVEATGGHVAFRAWDRLVIELDPPLAPGVSRSLELALAGRPSLGRLGAESFVAFFRRELTVRFAWDRFDWFRARQPPAASAAGVRLGMPMLAPVPRYTRWTLDGHERVPAEAGRPPVDLDLELEGPQGLVLADSCGHASAGGRLVSRCRTSALDYLVVGGRYELVELGSGVRAAVFPAHVAQLTLHGPALGEAAELVAAAWPGLEGLARGIVLERPWYRTWNHSSELWRFRDHLWYDVRPGLRVRVHGRLVELDELDLIGSRPLSVDQLAAGVVAAALTSRRPLAFDERTVLWHLVQAVAALRLGLGPETGAVVPAFLGGPGAVTMPALEVESYFTEYWRLRFPGLIADLEHRVGRSAFERALERFLDPAKTEPARVEELFALLEGESGLELDGFYADFFTSSAFPELALESVEVRQEGESWRVTGAVRNVGGGEVVCPVELVTEVGRVATEVLVAREEGPVAFALETRYRPLEVLLDPGGVCHRYRRPHARERVHLEVAG